MELLYFLERIRVPVVNELMLAVTTLGEETAFLVLALIFFWCVDKRKGYYLMAVGFIGTILNQFLKLLFRVPRPWVRDPDFTILEQAKEAAAGYSFPSGHTQIAVGTFGGIAVSVKQRWLKALSVAFMILVPFSRMYIGVHTPQDVLVSAVLALVLVWMLRKIVMQDSDKEMKLLIAGVILLALGLLAYVELYPFPGDVDAHNLLSGQKNAYTMIGCMTGVAVVYPLEKRFVQFSERAVWWAQILKVALGLGLVLLVKEGLRSPLDALFAGHLFSRSVRYFLIVTAAGLLWPMSFRLFCKLGKKG